ncbi:DoxX-like family protein [Thalassobius sp. I31.1]|uniref:DoxX-like family protein n=1 Tax=Thalassobius sp. I31.1 TaxID=2109912 RepID=UPI000D1A264B|nr:DoxX-like family protein [Thalassobius sp. I31.1]
MKPRVLILGGDGFIGRHIAFECRAAGWDVLACARRAKALRHMGFEVLQVDLTAATCHEPNFWQNNADRCDYVVNAAGLLTGSEDAFEAVHVVAPQAVYRAFPAARKLLISAVGIDKVNTPFAIWRRKGEVLARVNDVICLRPGLVLGDTSYGGSSLLRALASLPVTPLPGGGAQVMNPIHAQDLAKSVHEMLERGAEHGPQDIGGPENVTQKQMIAVYRAWMGLAPCKSFALPARLARLAGKLGDFMKMGPISTTALAQLDAGVLARGTPPLQTSPRGFTAFLNARPAGTQDLWQARLFLLRPLLRLTLIFMWVLSGLIGLFLPSSHFLPLLAGAPLPDIALIAIARIGGVADLAIALALLRGWRLKLMGWVQISLVGSYTLGLTILAPTLWLLPIGGLLKNLPILLLLIIFLILEEER